MLVFKDPVPLNITRAAAIRMGRAAAARFGYTHPLSVAHMANQMGGRTRWRAGCPGSGSSSSCSGTGPSR